MNLKTRDVVITFIVHNKSYSNGRGRSRKRSRLSFGLRENRYVTGKYSTPILIRSLTGFRLKAQRIGFEIGWFTWEPKVPKLLSL